jgi:hypothetical protein
MGATDLVAQFTFIRFHILIATDKHLYKSCIRTYFRLETRGGPNRMHEDFLSPQSADVSVNINVTAEVVSASLRPASRL